MNPKDADGYGDERDQHGSNNDTQMGDMAPVHVRWILWCSMYCSACSKQKHCTNNYYASNQHDYQPPAQQSKNGLSCNVFPFVSFGKLSLKSSWTSLTFNRWCICKTSYFLVANKPSRIRRLMDIRFNVQGHLCGSWFMQRLAHIIRICLLLPWWLCRIWPRKTVASLTSIYPTSLESKCTRIVGMFGKECLCRPHAHVPKGK